MDIKEIIENNKLSLDMSLESQAAWDEIDEALGAYETETDPGIKAEVASLVATLFMYRPVRVKPKEVIQSGQEEERRQR